jgi:DNA helicase-2/ATP-dependent DNA helicase PcrA
MNLNQEKQKIIALDGNVLVTANPGSGKTLLLAGKYVDLIKKDLAPEDILCLTFTNKARKEMEDRILKFIKEDQLKVDISKLNVYTFHSFCLESIDDEAVLSSNLLRYAVFRYITEHDTLSYGTEYLVETIVPKMENLIRYLKNFTIMPDDIDAKKAKKFLEDDKKYDKADLERFLDEFINIYRYYEQVKKGHGIDYTDMLLSFFKLKRPRKYKFVLVDELQDVNAIQAEIALRSGESFFAVGDKKQAIFGFQGGSIVNFDKFNDSTKFILSDNFRSTNQILDYAREYFVSRTKEEVHKLELKDLKNVDGKKGDKPVICEVPRENSTSTVCSLAKQFVDKGKQVAIITRTNLQILPISKELQSRDMEHSTTFFSASKEAKENIITFLKGVLSNEVQLVKNSMFTPFFPIPLQEAFELNKKRDLKLEDVYAKCPDFKKLRESVKTIEDLNLLFKERIIPVAISYGEEYLIASLSVQEACMEAIKILDDKTIENLSVYLESSDMLSNESDIEKKIILTTVHKAKGKEFDTVIYLPSKTTDRSNFQDRIVEAILKSKGINAEEELEEETLRVDFVAFTRAKEKLIILTEKPTEYLNDFSEKGDVKIGAAEAIELSELKKRAYALFVNKDYEAAKKLLETKKEWIKNYVKAHFESLDHISFSRLKDKAYDYLVESILGLSEPSDALNLGSIVHETAEKILRGEEYDVDDKAKPYVENLLEIIKQIKAEYPEIVCVEEKINDVPLSKIMATKDGINFKGQIDAVFKNKDKYLIVDWKTSATDDGSGGYRQQLSVYQRIYSVKKNIPTEKIKVAICYVGLRKRINDGIIRKELDEKQPAPTAFGTITKKLERFLSWRADVDKFFADLKEEEVDDVIWRSVIEQWAKEKII